MGEASQWREMDFQMFPPPARLSGASSPIQTELIPFNESSTTQEPPLPNSLYTRRSGGPNIIQFRKITKNTRPVLTENTGTLPKPIHREISIVIMVLESIDIENNNNMETSCGYYKNNQIHKNLPTEEEMMERQLLAKIMHLLPEGYNLPTDVTQYELIMYTIQYINALQSLTRQQ